MGKHLRISELNRRVQLWGRVLKTDEQGVPELNELGQEEHEDKFLATLWAGIVPQTGSLLQGRAADTTLTRTTHKIVCRYRTDISEDMWFIYQNRRYNILYVLDPYAAHEKLEVFCEVLI